MYGPESSPDFQLVLFKARQSEMLPEADVARRFRNESAREKTGKARRWPTKSLLVVLALGLVFTP